MAEHLSDETLARMVEGPAAPDERRHVEACARCREELRALREQTHALGTLPLLRPPRGDWRSLEARLRAEGLLRTEGVGAGGARSDRSRTGPVPPERRPGSGPGPLLGTAPLWMRVAAALALFVGGGVAGAAFTAGGTGPLATGGAGAVERFAADGAGGAATPARTAEEAAEEVRIAEQRYVEALLRYRELSEPGGGGAGYDPSARYAALDRILAASRAAVREAPADPFLNGVLVSTLAERHATLQRISSTGDGGDWY